MRQRSRHDVAEPKCVQIIGGDDLGAYIRAMSVKEPECDGNIKETFAKREYAGPKCGSRSGLQCRRPR
jgi:hypothetical protein